MKRVAGQPMGYRLEWSGQYEAMNKEREVRKKPERLGCAEDEPEHGPTELAHA